MRAASANSLALNPIAITGDVLAPQPPPGAAVVKHREKSVKGHLAAPLHCLSSLKGQPTPKTMPYKPHPHHL
jgi:hypothetical protein